MADIYAAPQAELEQEISHDWGSLERGQAGQYTFSAWGALAEAWEKTKGAKLTINLIIAAFFLLVFALFYLSSSLMSSLWARQSFMTLDFNLFGMVGFTIVVFYIVLPALTMPLATGLFMTGVRRAAGVPISFFGAWQYYSRIIPLFLCNLAIFVLIFLILLSFGLVLGLVVGISTFTGNINSNSLAVVGVIGWLLPFLLLTYLGVALLLSFPLIADKKIPVITALLASRRAVHHRWFSIFGLFLIIFAINFLPMILLAFLATALKSTVLLIVGLLLFMIAQFWILPTSVISVGIVYRNIFGCSQETLQP